MMLERTLAALTLCALALLANAYRTEAIDVDAVQPSPPARSEASTDNVEEDLLEPEITITTKRDEIHEEYRINGRLYMIKIIPAKGPPYYLIDYDGTGEFRRSNREPTISPPLWVLQEF